MTITDHKHKLAIEANQKLFDADMAEEYDKLPSMLTLSFLFAKRLLEYNVEKPRKTPEESYPLLGDPDQDYNGFDTSLPDVQTFRKQFPNSVFKPGMKLMDFACGSGLVTQRFAPYLESDSAVKTEIFGIDVSPLFLAKYDEKAKEINTKYSGIEMKSELCDILDPKSEVVTSQYEGSMDVIVTTLAYHHIENYQKVTQKLATFLKPGGWLFIYDFYNEDVESIAPNDENAPQSVRHMGGLRIDALNETLSQYANLTHASSARDVRTCLWMQLEFIADHMTQRIIRKWENNELRKKSIDGRTFYLVETSIILAVGQKK